MRILLGYCLLSVFIAFCYNIKITEVAIACPSQCAETDAHQYSETYTKTYTQTPLIALNDQTPKQAINNPYRHYPEMSCHLTKHARNVPEAKYIIRRIKSTNKYNPVPYDPGDHYFGAEAFRSSEPVSYYVFGLRKIVI